MGPDMFSRPSEEEGELAWQAERLRVGRKVLIQEGPEAGVMGRTTTYGKSMDATFRDCVQVQLAHREVHTLRIVELSDVQMVPDRFFNLLSDLRGELLALEAEPRGMEKYLIEELGQWYTLHMPRPPVHVSRVKITGGSTTPMAVPMPSQVTRGTNTTATMRNLRERLGVWADERRWCLERAERHPWLENFTDQMDP